MPNEMDYSLLRRTPDGSGMILVTSPGTPETGAFETEQDLKNWITAGIGGGIVPKGDILSSNLPAADESNKGWEYYCTDLNKYAISDGTAWIYFSNSPIVQTPDATDTGHALSNAVVTQCCNEVKGKLNQHDARLQNLEQKAGDYGTWHYPNDPNHSSDMPNAVPTGKAKYGLVKNIVGKSRAWNQLLPPSAQGSTVVNDVTIASDGNGAYTLNGTASSYIYTTIKSSFQNDMVVGHKYLIFCNSPSGNVYLADSYSNKFDVNSAAIFDYTTAVAIWIGLHVRGGATVNETVKPMVRDLTLIFGAGNEPSTVADALAQLPSLGQYNAYDAGSLVDTVVSGVEAIGFNRLDLDTYMSTLDISKTGDYYVATANNFTNKSEATQFPVSFKPNTQYSFRLTGYCASGLNRMELMTWYTDGTYETLAKNTSSSLATATGTSASGKSISKITFNFGSGGNSNFSLKSICISEGTDTVTDLPYKKSTLTLSEPVTLRSAGSVADELDVESGVITRKVGSVDMGTLTWTQIANYDWGKVYGSKISDIHNETEVYAHSNIISSKYATRASNDTNPNNSEYLNCVYQIIQSRTYNIGVCLPASSSTSDISGYLAYELATPTTESIDPVPDNTLYTEGGGTIDTIQDQTPVIDNCLDVGYLAL